MISSQRVARRRAAASREREVERVVQDAGVDPVRARRRRGRECRVAGDLVELGRPEAEDASGRRGVGAAQLEQGAEHGVASLGQRRQVETTEVEPPAAPGRGLALGRRQQDQHPDRLGTDARRIGCTGPRIGEPVSERVLRVQHDAVELREGIRRDPGRARGRGRFPARGGRGRGGRGTATRGCRTWTGPTSPSSPSTRRACATSTRRCTSSATTTATSCTTRSPTSARSSSPAEPIDLEAHRRGESLYGADTLIPLHPLELSEGAASLLPGRGAAGVPVDASGSTRTGPSIDARVERALVRSRAQLDYAGAQRSGRRRHRRPGARAAQGGRRAPDPPGGGPRRRQPADARAGRGLQGRPVAAGVPPSCSPCGELERADLAAHRVRGGVDDGLRPCRRPADASTARPGGGDAAAPHRAGARHRLAGRADLSRLHPGRWTRPSPATRRWRSRPRRCCAAPGTPPSTARSRPQAEHAALASEYAHVTAPLRRLVDRYGLEVCVALSAGTEVPDWVRAALHDLPETMQRSGPQRARVRECGARPGRGGDAPGTRGGAFHRCRGRRRARRSAQGRGGACASRRSRRG